MIVPLVYLYSFSLPFIGIIQLIGLINRCKNLGDRIDPFANDLRIYKSFVMKYFLGLAVLLGLCCISKHNDANHFLVFFNLIYVMVLPGIMAVRYWIILANKDEVLIIH